MKIYKQTLRINDNLSKLLEMLVLYEKGIFLPEKKKQIIIFKNMSLTIIVTKA